MSLEDVPNDCVIVAVTEETIDCYMDQARDWVSVNCPDLDGEAWDQKVREVAKELASNDPII